MLVSSVAFSPNGRHLAAACRDGQLRVFDPGTCKLVAAGKEHRGPVSSLAFSPDGRRLLTVGRDSI